MPPSGFSQDPFFKGLAYAFMLTAALAGIIYYFFF